MSEKRQEQRQPVTRQCAVCGEAFALDHGRGRGRYRLYCGSACKQAAYRRRKRAADDR